MAESSRLLVAISMHPGAMTRLRESAEVDVLAWNDPRVPTVLGSYDGAVIYTPPADPVVMRQSSRLKVFACHSCPPDIAQVAIACGIHVTLVPSLWATVADMTLALLFAAARNVPQVDAAIRRGEWGPFDLKVRHSGLDVFGKTLGIVGLGRIGSLLAHRVQGFDMRILYHDLQRKPELERELRAEFVALDELLAASDFVVLLAPLTDASRGMLGERELRLMKRTAVLVNTGRGALIDQPALVRALRERWIAAAALDVYVEEPLAPGHPLLELDNVVLSPHLGGSTLECDMTLVNDVLRVLSGLDPLHPWA
jgi:phosphoglycerate dehydrogenase-like enzyme